MRRLAVWPVRPRPSSPPAKSCSALASNREMLPFDLTRSHALYKALFGQVEDLIHGKQLLIVPSGALTQLPFQVLVTEQPGIAIPSDVRAYASVKWLGQRQPIAVLPAVSSLKALRRRAGKSGRAGALYRFRQPA